MTFLLLETKINLREEQAIVRLDQICGFQSSTYQGGQELRHSRFYEVSGEDEELFFFSVRHSGSVIPWMTKKKGNPPEVGRVIFTGVK